MAKARASRATKPSSVQPAVMPLREQHRRATYDRLIASAEQLFQENGFRATTVEQIAKISGTSATTFYRHFKSKSELANIVHAQLTVEVLDAMRKLEAVRNPTRQAVRAWMNQYYEMWQRIYRLSEAFWEAASADDEFAAGVLPSTLAMTGELTELLERIPTSVRSRVHLRLALIVILMDRVAFIVRSRGEDPRRSPIFDEFADIFHAAVFTLKG